jgi:hypothetical protein
VKRQIRLVLTVFCIALLLGAVLVVLNATEKAYDNGIVVFRDYAPTDVRSVSISNEYGNMLVEYVNDGYTAGDIPIELVDMDRFVGMMTNSGAVYAVNSISNPGNLADYGLDKAASSVAIEYNDGQSIKIFIGNPEPISDGYYCRVEGEDGVYLFEEKQVYAFLQPQKYYISLSVTPQIPSQSQSSLGHVLAAEFEGGRLEEPVRLKPVVEDDQQIMLDALSYGSATHMIDVGGKNYRVDQKYATEVFDSIVGMAARDIVGYNFSEQEMKDFGFDKPDMRVRFDFRPSPDANPIEYNLLLLDKNGVFYIACNNRGVIYEVEQPFFYSAASEKFPVRWFFSPLLFDLDELEITIDGQNHLFELSGSTISDLEVRYNGKKFDIDRFRKLYQLVTSAAHDNSKTEQAAVGGDSLMTITYRYRNTDKASDTLALYPAEPRRHYAEVNGAVQFTIKEQFYTRVAQALDVLETDAEFELEW